MFWLGRAAERRAPEFLAIAPAHGGDGCGRASHDIKSALVNSWKDACLPANHTLPACGACARVEGHEAPNETSAIGSRFQEGQRGGIGHRRGNIGWRRIIEGRIDVRDPSPAHEQLNMSQMLSPSAAFHSRRRERIANSTSRTTTTTTAINTQNSHGKRSNTGICIAGSSSAAPQ